MLSERERDGLLSLGMLHEWATGSTLLMEGDTAMHVLVLDAGWVKVVAALEEGGEALLALRSRGDLVGEQAAVENAPRSASVVSAIPVRAYIIQREPFLKYLTDHPRVHHAVTHALSAKLRSETRRRVDFGILRSDVRLARVLGDLARRNSRLTDEGMELGYTLTQPELAAMVGISEPSLQRALRKLRELGVVDTGYRRIVILDMTKLDGIARPGWNGGQDSIR